MKERVQKLMAQANLGSRRACEEIISQGRVQVNGKVIHLGDQADPATDVIVVDGVRLKLAERKRYIAFYKPKNVLSTDEPHEGDTRRTVRDYLPFEEHLFSAGRLDADSEGLMVLTNDGELANRLTHPRYRHTKTYKVTILGIPTPEALQRWQKGVMLENEDGSSEITAPCSVTITDSGKGIATLRVIMTEGKKRQIRRVASLLGYHVRSLIRTHIGRFELGALRPGEWRELTDEDIRALKTPAQLPPAGPQRRSSSPRKGTSARGDRSRSRPQASRNPRKRR
jgi:pseudouridine synthase